MRRLIAMAATAAALLCAQPAAAATYFDLPLNGITTFEIAKPVAGTIDLTASWDRYFNIDSPEVPFFETVGDYGYSTGITCDLSTDCTGSENGLFAGDFIKLTTTQSANSIFVTIRTSLSEFDFCGSGSFASTCAIYYQAGVQFDGEATQVVTSPVPEPTTWAFMLAGFGLAGWALRRRHGDVEVGQRLHRG